MIIIAIGNRIEAHIHTHEKLYWIRTREKKT